MENIQILVVCLIDDLDAHGRPSATFTTAQYASLERLLLALRSRFPKAQILGHRDLPKVKKDVHASTSAPGGLTAASPPPFEAE
jgi:N-acetyl-anhydromuramyl-L-alanine amidase AmpD